MPDKMEISMRKIENTFLDMLKCFPIHILVFCD